MHGMTMLLMLPMYAVVVSTVLLRSVEELCDPTIIISIISSILETSSEGGKLLLSSCVHAVRTDTSADSHRVRTRCQTSHL
jgi:hypothetical protein